MMTSKMSDTQNAYTLCSLLFDTTTEDYNTNLQTLLKLVDECKDKSLIVAPEVCLTSYDYDNFDEVLEFANIANEALKKASKDKIIIMTMIEKRDEKVYNFAKIFHNGEVVYERAKARLFRFGDEHKYMVALINQCYVVASDSLNEECTKMSGIITPMGEAQRNENKPCLEMPYSKKEIKTMRKYMDVGIK